MKETLKKLFGGIELSWKKLIILSVISGVYTAIAALVPQLEYTSFYTITTTLEMWIFFGIIIIMNSKSNIDSALKCFVFFLISQPLVYLIQVPFSDMGWSIFMYYKTWFYMTLLCFPMGFIGYYIKKDKWYGYIILLPMIALTLASYRIYLTYFTFDYPKYLLISIFCATVSIMYPIVLFNNKKIKLIGPCISAILVIAITISVFLHPYVYSTEIMGSVDGKQITNEYSVMLEDEKYGEVCIEYHESLESYLVHADFKRSGQTKLLVTTPEGETKTYNLEIKRDTFSYLP